MKKLAGKIAVVTGAAMGMGRELSSMLLDEGCKVALVDINREALEKTKADLSSQGDCEIYICDITQADAVSTMADTIKKELGSVDILVNNAGIVIAKPVLELNEKEIEAMIQVNLTAQFWTTKAFLPDMVEKKAGHIVNYASAGGILAIPNLSGYCASKFGVVGFSDAIRQEMKREKLDIGVTVVCPNTVSTGMFAGAKMVGGTNMLTPENVCKQVIKGIKRNKPMVAIPAVSVSILTPLLKALLPITTMDWVNKTLGVWGANDATTGRS
ncbi:MAG: SDR family NAD(P)-dependent oxidoreductase [bacterium]|nr:SDR family NAD(P)-dependent oxidoreductase [bacterium]